MYLIFNILLKGYLVYKPFLERISQIVNHPTVSNSNPVSLQNAKLFNKTVFVKNKVVISISLRSTV